MLLTVSWPAKEPSTSTAKGYVVPARAALRSRLTRARKVLVRGSAPGGTVASQRTSQAALRCRAERQAAASETASGRRVTRDRCRR